MLCKHEVVGSIPSGSTSLRWLRQLRLGEPHGSEGCHVEARKSEDGLAPRLTQIIVRETSLRMLFILRDAACVISDIVKRRSIRVGSRSKQFARTFIISGSFSALAFSREADGEL